MPQSGLRPQLRLLHELGTLPDLLAGAFPELQKL
jgi:hypothetical protein